jgi:hypothetical protein
MIDTYLMADDFETLATFCASFRNVTGPARGRAALAGYEDEDGVWVPAEEAKGDPSKFYACIRAPFQIPLAAPILLADKIDCEAVCGEWCAKEV